MSGKTKKYVRLGYGIALSVMTVILGALFIWQVIDTYQVGKLADATSKFEQSDVFARVKRISPAFWIWVVMIAGGFVVWEVFPEQAKKPAYTDDVYALRRLKKRTADLTFGNGELAECQKFIKREEKKVKLSSIIPLAVGVAGIIYAIVYLSVNSHFSIGATNTNNVLNDMYYLVINLLPWALAVYVCALGVAYFESYSAKKQLPYAKKLVAGKAQGTKVSAEKKGIALVSKKAVYVLHHRYFILGLRIAVACIGVAFVIAGIFNGNVAKIIDKAINICLECIGIG